MAIVGFFDYGGDKDVRFPDKQDKSGEGSSSPLCICYARDLPGYPSNCLKVGW
ncbi:MAG TPA: hypothetical protein VF369_00280 [candidate division Zixibacteria bacterium]